jgi:peptidoglycan/LPS O-acetylase OafA/YrhL
LLYSTAAIGAVLPMYLKSLVLFPQGPWIDGIYWTLTIEVAFYAVTLLLIASGGMARLRPLALVASIALLGFYMLAVGARLWPEMPLASTVLAVEAAYVSRLILLTTGAYFLVGANLYLLHRDGWNWQGVAALGASLAAGTVGVWLAAEGTAAVLEHERSPATPVIVWLVVVGLLALSLRFHRTGQDSARMRSLARSAGLVSYPLYLFHNISGAFLFGLLLAAGVGAYPALLAAVAIAVAVSVGFAIWVEPPLRTGLARRLSRWAERIRATVSIGEVKDWDRT